MAEWVEETAARVAAFHPRRVLEIGCGTGLLLLRLARSCSNYLGTDFSGAALARLEAQIASLEGLSPVRLVQREADDFDGVHQRSVDAVVLNSVVQYFPGAGYLRTVLERAVAATADGGVVFVGDVRDLSLQRAFHASVALHRASPEATLDEVVGRFRDRLEREPELLLHPAFFARLADRLPRIAAVEIRPRAGRAVNELTAYRYDVALRIGVDRGSGPEVVWREPATGEWTEEGVHAELAASPEAEVVGVRGVRDPRLERDLAAVARLEHASAGVSVAELTEALGALPPSDLTPERLRAVARRHGREVELAWAGAPGRFDALFSRPLPTRSDPPWISLPGVAAARHAPDPAGGLANLPLRAPVDGDLADRLRRFLAARLPASHVPSAITCVRHLPRGATGKIDRGALPEPEASARPSRVPRAPRDELEAALLAVWERVLGRAGIGVDDDFFDLGGHSLLGVRLLAEVEKQLARRVPLQSLFRFSTIEGMAELLREDEDGATDAASPSLSPTEVRDLHAAMAASRLPPLGPGSLLTAFHVGGSRPPLFWCFNVPSREPANLAARLGDDQPLYALLSGVGVLYWRDGTPAALAAHYLDQLLAVQSEGPYRLGGNCAGARVAIALAGLLRQRGARVERLCVMEHFEPALWRYADPMLLLYGRDSHVGAYRDFGWGEPGWQEAFLRVPRVEWIPGRHGEYFEPEYAGTVAAAIAAFL